MNTEVDNLTKRDLVFLYKSYLSDMAKNCPITSIVVSPFMKNIVMTSHSSPIIESTVFQRNFK